MGIENRDYVRGGSSGYGGYANYGGGYGYRSGMPPACKWLLILNIAVFVLQLVWTAGPSDAEIQKIKTQLVKQYQRLRNLSPEETDQDIQRDLSGHQSQFPLFRRAAGFRAGPGQSSP